MCERGRGFSVHSSALSERLAELISVLCVGPGPALEHLRVPSPDGDTAWLSQPLPKGFEAATSHRSLVIFTMYLVGLRKLPSPGLGAELGTLKAPPFCCSFPLCDLTRVYFVAPGPWT